MNVLTRGIRNAFRNRIRTVSLVIIIGLSIGLSLSMLVARQAVTARIASVNASVGNTITIAPAGFSGFSSVNNALTTAELAKVSAVNHVTNVTETLTDRLTTIGSSTPSFGFGGNGSAAANNSNATTSITSPVKLNTSGSGGNGPHVFVNGGGSLPANFSLPITVIGTNDPASVDGNTLTITSGKTISGTSDANDALISSSMASKNNLTVGSTFTAYSTTMTVAGIFTGSDTSSVGGDVIVSLPAEQRLSSQSGDVTSAIATVDSLPNLSSATTAIKNALGSSADVTSAQQQADQTVQPLNNIKTITLYSLVGAIIAGSVIILLTMIMIVRERRREIGVLKAIGASNLKVMGQFMTEAITLTILGAMVGIVFGVVAANPITKLLVTNSTNSSTTTTVAGIGGGGGFRGGGGGVRLRTGGTGFRGVRNGISNIHAIVGYSIIVDGLVAAIVIAVLGSAAASFFISKVRPAEVMRVE